jgi:hypothetical protein
VLGQDRDYGSWARGIITSPSKWRYAVWSPGQRQKAAEQRAQQARARYAETLRRRRAAAARKPAPRKPARRVAPTCAKQLADCKAQLRAYQRKAPTTLSWAPQSRSPFAAMPAYRTALSGFDVPQGWWETAALVGLAYALIRWTG